MRHARNNQAASTCPDCATMAAAQAKLAKRNERLQARLDILLKAFSLAYSEEDTIDWRESAGGKE